MILVTGGGGALGRSIAETIRGNGTEVLIGTRHPTGPDQRAVDFDRPETLADAFGGVDIVVMISAGYAEDDVVYARHRAAITAAENAGVRNLVYTSLFGAGDHLSIAPPHRYTERLLTDSALDATILRNGLYAELFAPQAQRAVSTGELELAWGEGGFRPVTREDLAVAAATVACSIESARAEGTASVHAGQVYELDGTEYIDGPALAAALSEAAGRQITYRSPDLGEVREALPAAGLLPYQVAHTISLLSNIQAGFLDGGATALPDLLPREPRGVVATMLGTAG